MISLEQIRLLEGKVSRALELIRVLKEENATLRRGLESAQRRMKELETLIEGFKADQKEIEVAILRTLESLDELEESVAPRGSPAHAGADHGATARAEASAVRAEPPAPAAASQASANGSPAEAARSAAPGDELDIF